MFLKTKLGSEKLNILDYQKKKIVLTILNNAFQQQLLNN